MITYPSQEDLEANLLNSLHHTEFLTYALVVGEELRILRTAPNFSSFLGDKSSINGRYLADVFVEFIGSQDALQEIMREREGVFRLDYVAREVKDRTLRYYTIEVHPYKGVDNALLLLLLDTTVAGRLQQRLTQERNELNFEVQRHEVTQKLLKDSRTKLMRKANRRAKELERVNLMLQEEINERKRVQDELLQTQKLDAIGVLAGGIAHDFNNLLTVISTYSSQMMKMYGDDERIHRYSKQINEAGKQAHVLTNKLLAFGRKQISRPTMIDVNEQIREVYALIQRMLGNKISVEFDLSDDLHPITMDSAHFTQILINLLLNARDAMVNGGTIRIRSKNIVENEYEGICIVIADEGVGMSDEIRTRIFEPFFTTKGAGKGIGLGLSTVYGIVHDTGGEIVVESNVGVGTTFCVLLPKSEPSDDLRIMSPPKRVKKAPADTTVLIVDDVLEVLNLVQVCLDNEGYQTMAAATAKDAIELVQDEEIDLIVSDVIMPGMNGKQMVEQLRRTHGRLFRVLYISGFSDEIITQQDIDVERVNLLMKPFTSDSLVQAVAKILDGE